MRPAGNSRPPAGEVLEHSCQPFLRTPEFTLHESTKCRVGSSYEPEVNGDGEQKSGLDVVTDSGQPEFTVGNTGWGQRLSPGRETPGHKKGPAR
jgi:hypothetical protein